MESKFAGRSVDDEAVIACTVSVILLQVLFAALRLQMPYTQDLKNQDTFTKNIRSGRTRWPELDGLRGLAILMVFFLHYVTDSRTNEGNFGLLYHFAQMFRLGWSGVDLFFVLSGFLIGGILLDARLSPSYFTTFYTRRAYRILPIYYLWLLIYGAVGFLIARGYFPHGDALSHERLGLVPYFLFLQNITGLPRFLLGKYMVSPTWSLAVEEQFYLIAPVLIRYLSLKSLTRLLLACVVSAPVLRYLVFTRLVDGSTKANILMPCRADALAVGMLAAIAWRTSAKDWLQQRRTLLKFASGILALGFVLMIKWLPGPRTGIEAAFQFSWIAMLFASLLLTVLIDTHGLAARIARLRILRSWGRISYCFYLLHLGALGICHWVFLGGFPRIDDLPGLLVTFLAAFLTWIISQISWKYLEKPLIDRGHSNVFSQ